MTENRWIHLCGDDNNDTARVFYGVIKAMYHRDGHHTLKHVSECLDIFWKVEDALSPVAIEFAIWLHDIVYTPGHRDNERRSAMLAGVMLRELHMGYLVESVQKLIMATRDHLVESESEALMVDIDLSILGSDPARYDEYTAHIRQEFSSVADRLYRAYGCPRGFSREKKNLLDGNHGGTIRGSSTREYDQGTSRVDPLSCFQWSF